MPKFQDFNLVVNNEVETLTVDDVVVSVKKYLPVELKAALVSLAVRGAVNEGIVDEILLDAYFHIFLIENYTDILFTDSPTITDILDAYNKIYSSGLLSKVIELIPHEEYTLLVDSANYLKNELNLYNQSYKPIPSPTRSKKARS